MKRGTAILAWNVWTTFQISDEELKYFQVAIACCPMNGSGTIRVSRCWITVLFQGKELLQCLNVPWLQQGEVVYLCLFSNMMGHTLVHQSNTSQCVDDLP